MPVSKPKLVKTRQSPEPKCKEPAEFGPRVDPPRGVLQVINDRDINFSHQRLAPPSALQPWIQHFWLVTWDFRGLDSRTAETLPHPSCYLVLEQDLAAPPDRKPGRQWEIFGVTTGKFTRVMEGYRRVFGVKFKPGALRPFLEHKVNLLTDKVKPAATIFGTSICKLAQRVSAVTDAQALVDLTCAYLLQHIHHKADLNVELSSQLVELILNDGTILTVERLAELTGYSVRTLQRLFQEYVGVSPKWVIRRYRLHELLQSLHRNAPLDMAQLALELGYVDQAHLINDFRNLAGYTPEAYRKRVNVNRSHPQP